MSKQRVIHNGKPSISGSTSGEIIDAYVVRSQQLADTALQKLDACFDSRQSLLIAPTNVQIMQDDYLALLATKFPMLDESELKVCVLVRTYYTPLEIAALLNIGFSNVEAICERISKKLGAQLT